MVIVAFGQYVIIWLDDDDDNNNNNNNDNDEHDDEDFLISGESTRTNTQPTTTTKKERYSINIVFLRGQIIFVDRLCDKTSDYTAKTQAGLLLLLVWLVA